MATEQRRTKERHLGDKHACVQVWRAEAQRRHLASVKGAGLDDSGDRLRVALCRRTAEQEQPGDFKQEGIGLTFSKERKF